jgi:hypothetical protein
VQYRQGTPFPDVFPLTINLKEAIMAAKKKAKKKAAKKKK